MRSFPLFCAATMVATILVACGDDSSGTGGGGGAASNGSSSSDTTSSGATGTGGTGGSGAVTAESATEAWCEGLDGAATVIDGEADPLPEVTVDSLYEIDLYQVDEPTQFIGGATVTIVEPGSYFLLVLDPANDGFGDGGYISTPDGQPDLDYAQCDGCFDVCEEVDSAFVYDIPAAGTYSLGFRSEQQESLRFVVATVD